VLGVVPQVAEPRHVVRHEGLVGPPHHELAALPNLRRGPAGVWRGPAGVWRGPAGVWRGHD
jgi:hypothetical protein